MPELSLNELLCMSTTYLSYYDHEIYSRSFFSTYKHKPSSSLEIWSKLMSDNRWETVLSIKHRSRLKLTPKDLGITSKPILYPVDKDFSYSSGEVPTLALDRMDALESEIESTLNMRCGSGDPKVNYLFKNP